MNSIIQPINRQTAKQQSTTGRIQKQLHSVEDFTACNESEQMED